MPRRSLFLLLFPALQAALDLKPAESLHVSNSTCPEGTVVQHGYTETNRISCKNCIEGVEYMDHPNVYSKCWRCSHCDTEHGLEVKENCTTKQNVKCGCMHGFFCSSEPCLHCDPCAKCEEDGIEEECTQTKNTKCKSKSKKDLRWFFLFILLTPIPILVWWYCSKKSKKGYSLPEHPNDEEHIEMAEHFPDIDLSPYIHDLANEMTKDQVLLLVRRLGLPQGTIDAAIEDNVRNTGEQKIKLLQTWYERNGIKNAHEKLIITLRQLNMRVIADKFEQNIKTVFLF